MTRHPRSGSAGEEECPAWVHTHSGRATTPLPSPEATPGERKEGLEVRDGVELRLRSVFLAVVWVFYFAYILFK